MKSRSNAVAGDEHARLRHCALGADPPNQCPRRVAPGGVRRVQDQDGDVLADRLRERGLNHRRPRVGRHDGQRLILGPIDGRVERHEAIHSVHARLTSEAVSVIVKPVDPRRRERRTRAIVEDDDDAVRLLARELTPQDLLALSSLGAGRQYPDVARPEPDPAEGRTEQQEHGGHREQDLPRMGHDHGGQTSPEVLRRPTLARPEHRPRIYSGPQHCQQGRQECQAIDHGQGDHEGAAEPDGPEVPEAERVEAEEPHRHCEAREEGRNARRPQRPAQGVGDGALANFVPEAAHDEERVVDGDRQADHSHDVAGIDGDGADA